MESLKTVLIAFSGGVASAAPSMTRESESFLAQALAGSEEQEEYPSTSRRDEQGWMQRVAQ